MTLIASFARFCPFLDALRGMSEFDPIVADAHRRVAAFGAQAIS